MGSRRWRVLLVGTEGPESCRLRALFAEPILADYVLEQTASTEEGLAAVDAGRHDVYLVQDRPGSRDGVAFLRAAGARDAAAPLLLLAGEPDWDHDLAAQAAGAMDYLPADRTDAATLERALRYALARRETGAVLSAHLRELERCAFENTVLAEMASLLLTCQTTEQACAIVTACAARLFPSQVGAVLLLPEGSATLTPVAVWGEPRLRPGECAFLHPAVADCTHFGCPPPAGALCVPLVAQGEALGVLQVQTTQPGAGPASRLPETEERLAHTVADMAALALASLRLRQGLREQATRDPLTNLFNRRHMEASLERELRRAERRQRPLGIILLDLDHFKRTNDTLGHDAGDQLLRAVGRFLQTHIRGEDLACRYGGEEFLLILTDSALEDTRRRAEQLREGIKALQAEHDGRPLGPVTASLGVAVFPEHGLTAEAVVRAADVALYQAKADGRDRVALSPVLPLAGPHFGRFVPPASLRKN
jgi:diguanylate cyclase (GGDEF)-like protein